MGHRSWQRRLREAGLSQRRLAELLGISPTALSKSLRGLRQAGVPTYLKAAILALEIMTPEQREAWLAAVEEAKNDSQDR